MKSIKPKNPRRERGMTLIEIMVAMAILVTMLLGVVASVIASSKLTRRGNVATIGNLLVRSRLDRVLMASRTGASLDVITSVKSISSVADTTALWNAKPTVTDLTKRWVRDPEVRVAGDETSGAFFIFDSNGVRDTAAEDAAGFGPTGALKDADCAAVPSNMLCREVLLFTGQAGLAPPVGGLIGQTVVPAGEVLTVWVRLVRGGDTGFATAGSQLVTR